MKRYERELYEDLRSDKKRPVSPISNVIESMGSIAQIVGNPLFKAEITLRVNLYYWDNIGGVFLLPAAIPPANQTGLPVYLFGLTDFHGGFVRSRQLTVLPLPWGWNAIAAPSIGIWNYTIWLNGFWNVVCQDGDYVMLVFNNVAGTNILGIVTIHCNNIAYGTFLNSFTSDLITVERMRLFTPIANIIQYRNPLTFAYQNLFGKLKTDTVDPYMYQLPGDFQNQIADIPISYPVDKNLMINYLQNFDCQQMEIVLYVKKVEPLTHIKVKNDTRR